jgi:plasmid stabilization system protein ParE
MNYAFLPEARAEFEQAVAYYDQCGLGLGDEFTDEVEAAVRRVLNQPDAWSAYHHGTRRCLTRRFPYGVIYQIRPGLILIVAVAHLRREPGYWIERLANPQ